MSLVESTFRYQPVEGIPLDLLAAGLLVAAICLAGFTILFWFSKE